MVTVPKALDPALFKFLPRTAEPGRDHPLAIRRFMARMGTTTPQEAMERATKSLLEEYSSIHAGLSEPVSVERLCTVANVNLTGVRPVRRSLLMRHLGTSSRNGPTGFLEFTPTGPVIRIPQTIEFERARVTVAHEIAHVLIHQRKDGFDDATIRLGSSPVEEAIAEYGARLLLMPRSAQAIPEDRENVAVWSVRKAHRAQVTVYGALARLGDPDMLNCEIRGAILWRPRYTSREPTTYEAISPYWHLCPDVFIPIGKCRARRGSTVAELAAQSGQAESTSIEHVHIGSLEGDFRVDGFAWGEADARVVLSVFRTLPS